MKLLSTYNRSADGTKIEEAEDGTGKYSYLLAKGKLLDGNQALRIKGIVPDTYAVLTKQGE